MKTKTVAIEKPDDMNLILGQTHFIKTVEDLCEALEKSVEGIKYGLAFCEASGERLIRHEGNDKELEDLAVKNAEKIACGHTFIIFMKDAFPINVMNNVRMVPEVCNIFAATANPLEVVVAETENGRGIIGVIDGQPPLGVENDEDKVKRSEFLRKIGY